MNRRPLPFLALALAFAPALALAVSTTSIAWSLPSLPPPPRPVSVPITLDHDRVIIDIEVARADGTWRKARAWVDTGNQHLLVGERLAEELGIEPAAPGTAETRSAQVWASRTPGLRLGDASLDVAGVKTRILPGVAVLPGVPAEVNLPVSVFRRRHLVLDYPKSRLVLATPGSMKPRGAAIPCRVNADTGLFQIEAVFGGERVQLGIDSGSAYTWVSKTLTEAWHVRHADWPRTVGSVGRANFFGFDFESSGVLMRAPDLRLGTLTARHVGVLGLDQEFFDWYSRKTADPVAGFLGANVLKGYRIEIDFAARMTYWERGPAPEAHDLDTVGLTLRPETDGRYTIAGIALKDGAPAVVTVQPGDVLVSVDGVDVANATMGTVADALGGRPGATRVLVVERGASRITVEAKVSRFP